MATAIETISHPDAMRRFSKQQRRADRTVAFVPTMGALHEGHASLIRRAADRADCVVTSIFVNPTQFGPNEDFEKYPRTLAADLDVAAAAGCDVVFTPETSAMYPEGVHCSVHVKGTIVETFEGASRPGHFDGVATIVAKLFNIVQPDFAVFGLKDYQQTRVVSALVRDLDFDIELDLAPTSREANGLARSSRNTYLTDEERARAALLYQTLQRAAEVAAAGEGSRVRLERLMADMLSADTDIRVDYAQAARAQDLSTAAEYAAGEELVFLLAVHLGSVRLIDNITARVGA